jgi:dolichol kinase
LLYYLLPQGSARLILLAVCVAVVTVDFLRLHVNGVKEGFILFFGSFLRRHEFTRLSGATYLLLGCLVTSLLFAKPIVIAACAYIIVGDTFAAILGQNIKSPSLFKGKTLMGSVGFLLAALATAMVIYYLPNSAGLTTLMIGAVAASVFEALPLPLDDNFAVPILCGIVMYFF